MKCLLYEARKQPKYDNERENAFMSGLAWIDTKLGFVDMSKAKNQNDELKETKFGKIPVGSLLSYQTGLREANFSAQVNLTTVPRINRVAPDLSRFPRFPLTAEAEMIIPWVLTEGEDDLLCSLIMDEEKINVIESSTREKSASDM